MSTQVSNVTARMLVLAERAVGANLAPQLVAELGEIAPLFAELIYPNGEGPDPQISQDVFAAELERLVTEAQGVAQPRGNEDDASWFAPTKKRRKRERELRDAAEKAIAILYPNGVPGRLILPNKKLCAEVCECLIEHLQIATIKRNADGSYSGISPDTIRRAAGRRK